MDEETYAHYRSWHREKAAVQWLTDWKSHVVANRVELWHRIADMYKQDGAYFPSNKCLNATLWYNRFSGMRRWSRYSQRWQDSIIASLFLETNLGSTNKFFVEFGFAGKGYESAYVFSMSGSATKMLKQDLGWSGILFDIANEEPRDNLHKEYITPDTILSIFVKHGVPLEPDFVSIDIDSCDIYVFLELTNQFRPRVISIEYNALFPFDRSVTVPCRTPSGKHFDQYFAMTEGTVFGASLLALYKAGLMRGYRIVDVVPRSDVFMVREDLICSGTEVDLSNFANCTAQSVLSEKIPQWLTELLTEF